MIGSRRSRALFAVVGLTVALVACGGDTGTSTSGGPAPNAQEVPASGSLSVSGKEFSFEPSTLSAESGDVRVSFRNAGVMEHDFTVKGTSLTIPAKAGQTATRSAKLDPGTYTYICSIPGHENGGMSGTLTVN